jgi:hypothetical protein
MYATPADTAGITRGQQARSSPRKCEPPILGEVVALHLICTLDHPLCSSPISQDSRTASGSDRRSFRRRRVCARRRRQPPRTSPARGVGGREPGTKPARTANVELILDYVSRGVSRFGDSPFRGHLYRAKRELARVLRRTDSACGSLLRESYGEAIYSHVGGIGGRLQRVREGDVHVTFDERLEHRAGCRPLGSTGRGGGGVTCCPFCNHSYTKRSRRRWYERWFRRFTSKRPYRCELCRRRFWADVMAIGRLITTSGEREAPS